MRPATPEELEARLLSRIVQMGRYFVTSSEENGLMAAGERLVAQGKVKVWSDSARIRRHGARVLKERTVAFTL